MNSFDTKVFIVEWANGNTDVFASREEAEAEYKDHPDGLTVDHGRSISTLTAMKNYRESGYTIWSDAAKMLRQEAA